MQAFITVNYKLNKIACMQAFIIANSKLHDEKLSLGSRIRNGPRDFRSQGSRSGGRRSAAAHLLRFDASQFAFQHVSLLAQQLPLDLQSLETIALDLVQLLLIHIPALLLVETQLRH